MKRIVFDEDLNIKENSYIEFKSDKTHKTILKKATKYYSYDRLNLVGERDYKILTVKIEGKKYKLVVSQLDETEITKKEWQELFKKTHKNTILYEHVNMEEYTNEQNGEYKKIVLSKSYYKTTRRRISYWLNKLLWIAFTVLLYPVNPFVFSLALSITIIKLVGGVLIDFCGDDSYHNNPEDNGDYLMFSLLIQIIEYPAYFISKTINNTIGDIKNDSFSLTEICKKFASKCKDIARGIKEFAKSVTNKVKEIVSNAEDKTSQKRYENDLLKEDLTNIANSIDATEIKPKIYVLNPKNIIDKVVEFNDECIERCKRHIEIATKRIKNIELRKYYYRQLQDLVKAYNINKHTESDMIKNDITSSFTNLEEKLEEEIMINSNQKEIDDYLEEVKGNQLVKARR